MLKVELKDMKFAYKSGHNYAGPKANYYCYHCGLDLNGETEVGFVPAGDRYADGEWCKCPRCGELNPVEWDHDF